MHRKFSLIVLSLFILFISAFKYNMSNELGPEIKIGVLIPLCHEYGKSIKQGMDLAVKEINEKGLWGGRKLKLIYEDSAFNPKQSIIKTKKLLARDKVNFFIGGLTSGVTKAISGIVKKYKPIMVWGGATWTGVEKLFIDQNWFFHLHPWSYHNDSASINYMKYLNVKTVAFLYKSGEFGSYIFRKAERLIKNTNLKVVFNFPFEKIHKKNNPILLKMKSINPDALYIICYSKDIIPLFLKMRNLNINTKMIYIASPGWPKNFPNMSVSEYISALTLWAPGVKNKASRIFVRKFQAEYNRTPQLYWAPMGYVNVKVLARAIKRAGSLDRNKIIKALEKTNMKTPMGRLTFKPSRYIKHQGFTKWMSFQWRKGKMKVVYPKRFARVKLVYPMPKWSERE